MKDISTVSDLGIGQSSRVLVLMPHPDDEAVFISGLLQKLSSLSISNRAITFTAGEKSTLRYTLPPEADLATERQRELTNAFNLLGITDFQILTLPDGGLENETQQISKIVTQELNSFKPTIVLTLEPDGIYGHPDHIALSNTVTYAVKPPLKLLYATVSPNYIFPGARKMAKKQTIKPLLAEYRLRLTTKEALNKVKALRAHCSQFKIDLFHWKSILFFLKNDMLRHEYYSYNK